MTAKERFLKYVKVYTMSDPKSETVPTTMRQFDLANILAEEMKEKNPEMLREVEKFFAEYETGFKTKIEVEYVAHEQLKRLSGDCKAVIRTGETTPYANIILQSGCIF